ncbi:hypothetical protein GH714_037981 [Hevea brasiliensis]|uniref:Uncharacterized protein n=1 Tax=Hevea brasiliensis TaxID=3981 RepID=A0A6A6L0C1_HEVBR|nr:hypothetical protein GH714_037981 [Hevea brasiliensis]
MKSKNPKKRGSVPRGNKRGNKFAIKDDPFFNTESKKRRKMGFQDDYIDSGESEEENGVLSGGEERKEDEDEEIDQFAQETADEKRQRMAKSYKLIQEQLEESGRLRRVIASRVEKPDSGFEVLLKHRHSVTAAFPGHRGPVSCLTFRQGTSELFSGSFDRSIKIWNVEDRAYISTLFGHQSEVLTVDCLRKERVLATGRDRTMQLFKVPEESRLIFRASASSLECCCFIDNDEFLSGSDDGNIELWSVQKRSLSCSWVSSVAVCRGSDLAASGAGSGSVRLWTVESAPKGIKPLYDLPLVGFVNSLAFSKSGKFLVAGVGQEPRLGRWGRISAARNGVAIQRLTLS